MEKAIYRADIHKNEIQIVNMHATGTSLGDINEARSIEHMFNESPDTYINFTKGHIGHCMGAAGALELAGNIPSFEDNFVHPGMNLENEDPECNINNLVYKEAKHLEKIDTIMNNSFGMLGINSTVIIRKY
jgi:3-oxoacyl-[acyl-carrier-protein] synthase II